jgi:hypothetical protein
MSRPILLGLTIVVATVVSGTANAQQACPDDMTCAQSFKYDYYRNKMWPVPFRAMDANAVLTYFDVQRSNGWKLHNTLGTSMFLPDGQLTDSGRAHTKWILTNAPQNRRVVFVLQGDSQEETAARVEATQLAISQMVPVGPLPQIYLTDRDAPGSSGVYQTAVSRAMASSIPNPRLGSAPVPSQ